MAGVRRRGRAPLAGGSARSGHVLPVEPQIDQAEPVQPLGNDRLDKRTLYPVPCAGQDPQSPSPMTSQVRCTHRATRRMRESPKMDSTPPACARSCCSGPRGSLRPDRAASRREPRRAPSRHPRVFRPGAWQTRPEDRAPSTAPGRHAQAPETPGCRPAAVGRRHSRPELVPPDAFAPHCKAARDAFGWRQGQELGRLRRLQRELIRRQAHQAQRRQHLPQEEDSAEVRFFGSGSNRLGHEQLAGDALQVRHLEETRVRQRERLFTGDTPGKVQVALQRARRSLEDGLDGRNRNDAHRLTNGRQFRLNFRGDVHPVTALVIEAQLVRIRNETGERPDQTGFDQALADGAVFGRRQLPGGSCRAARCRAARCRPSVGAGRVRREDRVVAPAPARPAQAAIRSATVSAARLTPAADPARGG